MAKQVDVLCAPQTLILALRTPPDADASLSKALSSWVTPERYRHTDVYGYGEKER